MTVSRARSGGGAGRRGCSAGAEACVAPGFVARSSSEQRQLGVPAIPGALTPTEVEAAWLARRRAREAVPGSAVGPAYVRELLAPLAGIPLLVTGGIDARNAGAFLDAGAVAVGAGSALEEPAEVGAAS